MLWYSAQILLSWLKQLYLGCKRRGGAGADSYQLSPSLETGPKDPVKNTSLPEGGMHLIIGHVKVKRGGLFASVEDYPLGLYQPPSWRLCSCKLQFNSSFNSTFFITSFIPHYILPSFHTILKGSISLETWETDLRQIV